MKINVQLIIKIYYNSFIILELVKIYIYNIMKSLINLWEEGSKIHFLEPKYVNLKNLYILRAVKPWNIYLSR